MVSSGGPYMDDNHKRAAAEEVASGAIRARVAIRYGISVRCLYNILSDARAGLYDGVEVADLGSVCVPMTEWGQYCRKDPGPLDDVTLGRTLWEACQWTIPQ